MQVARSGWEKKFLVPAASIFVGTVLISATVVAPDSYVIGDTTVSSTYAGIKAAGAGMLACLIFRNGMRMAGGKVPKESSLFKVRYLILGSVMNILVLALYPQAGHLFTFWTFGWQSGDIFFRALMHENYDSVEE